MSPLSQKRDSLISSVSVQISFFLGFGCGIFNITLSKPNWFYKGTLKSNGGLNLMKSPNWPKPQFERGFPQKASFGPVSKILKFKSLSYLKSLRPNPFWPVQKTKMNILKLCSSSLLQDLNRPSPVLPLKTRLKRSRSFPSEMIMKMTASAFSLQ